MQYIVPLLVIAALAVPAAIVAICARSRRLIGAEAVEFARANYDMLAEQGKDFDGVITQMSLLAAQRNEKFAGNRAKLDFLSRYIVQVGSELPFGFGSRLNVIRREDLDRPFAVSWLGVPTKQARATA
jgi:hypothetical protein